MDDRPLVLHVVYRFDVGGLENGLVNLIDHMPAQAYRHAVLALTDVTDFRRRVRRDDVEFIALNKPPGHGVWVYPRVLRLVRRLRPAIVHTRNLAALEMAVPAALAGVPARIHGEHGRDHDELTRKQARYRRLRRLYRPFVHHHVAVSRDLADYLVQEVGVPEARVTRICNGVDTLRFRPGEGPAAPVAGCPFPPGRHWLVGTVGRMQAVKDQTLLARAFVRALALQPALRECLRLVMVGEGPLRAACEAVLDAAGTRELAWLPGERQDVPQLMRALHCFALPSLGEGVSNTILEAMASGLPVVATDVGANAELVAHGRTGEIVPAGDVEAMAHALVRMASDPQRAAAFGRAGRSDAERRFSLQAMVSAYQDVYDRELARAAALRPARREA